VPLLTDPGQNGHRRPGIRLINPIDTATVYQGARGVADVNYRYVSALWHRLMTELEYERYGSGGGDFGAVLQPDGTRKARFNHPESH